MDGRGDVGLPFLSFFLSLLILYRSLLSLFSCSVVAVAVAVAVAIYPNFVSFLVLTNLILLITHQELINCYIVLG